MSDARQVTVRFETSGEITDNITESDILLSGPVSIFATVDLFEELSDPALLEAVNAADQTVIVYCKDVRDENSSVEDQSHRGAYFFYKGIVEDEPVWQEILLGTHSHSNIDKLERLTELLGENKDSDMTILLKPDGSLELVPVSNSLQLPTLPLEILRKRALLEREYEVPVDSEAHHLDARLSELQDTYDWMNDSDPVVGSCRSLYRELIQADEPLYIGDVYENCPDELKKKILNLELVVLDFNVDKKEPLPGALKVERPTSSGDFVVALNTPWKFYQSDRIFLFDNGEFIPTDSCRVLPEFKEGEKVTDQLTLRFSRSFEKYIGQDAREITLLLVEEVDTYTGVISDTIRELDLNKINDELTYRYVRGALSRKPAGSKHYLAVDEHGNLSWEKTLLPTQLFYSHSGEGTVEEVQTLQRSKKYIVKYFFKDAIIGDGDHPLLMVNEQFAFSAKYEQKKNGLLVTVDLDDFFDFVDNEGPNKEKYVFSLIIVRNSASKSVADEFDRKYITKEDAVAILSHGHLEMKDYAKISDLLGYSKVGHIHAGYARKEHDHNYRYANFHHTHPELAALIASLSKGEVDDTKINEWISELETTNKKLLDDLVRDLGLFELNGKYFIGEDNLLIKDHSLVEKFNEKSVDVGIDPFPEDEQVYLTDILNRIILFFEHDTVKASQVELDKDIPVRLVNGPVGGIDSARVYKRGEHTLQTILEDMLNPYVLSERVREILTPSQEHTIVKYYTASAEDGKMTEIEDISKLKYAPERTETLYMTVELRNSKNEECKFIGTDLLGREFIQRALPIVSVQGIIIDADKDGFYRLFEINHSENQEYIDAFEISWVSAEPDDRVYDNYGTDEDPFRVLNPEKESFKYTVLVTINYPDIAYQLGDGELIHGYGRAEIHTLTDCGTVSVYVESDLKNRLSIYDIDTGYRLNKVFTHEGTVDLYESYYEKYTYEFLNEDEEVNILIFTREKE